MQERRRERKRRKKNWYWSIKKRRDLFSFIPSVGDLDHFITTEYQSKAVGKNERRLVVFCRAGKTVRWSGQSRLCDDRIKRENKSCRIASIKRTLTSMLFFLHSFFYSFWRRNDVDIVHSFCSSRSEGRRDSIRVYNQWAGRIESNQSIRPRLGSLPRFFSSPHHYTTNSAFWNRLTWTL